MQTSVWATDYFFFCSYSSCFLLTIIKKSIQKAYTMLKFDLFFIHNSDCNVFEKHIDCNNQCIIILYWINSNYFNKKHNDCRNQCVYNDFHLILPSWKFRCKNWHIELLIKRLDYELNMLLYLPRLSTITLHCTGIKKKTPEMWLQFGRKYKGTQQIFDKVKVKGLCPTW